MTDLSLAAAFMLGLLGSTHCLSMCGGLSGALGMGTAGDRKLMLLGLFQAGRVLSYTMLGAALGAATGAAASAGGLPMLWPRLVSAALLVAMGLYVSNWWRGLARLEQAGQWLWRGIQPVAARRLPLRDPGAAVLVGLCWGFLPCGLIYSALAWSATAASAASSALLMLCFGLGTVPAMLATSAAGNRLGGLLRHTGFRTGAALVLIAFGLWTAWGALQHAPPAGGHEHGMHQHH